MICITGDIHADLDRFKNKNIRKLKKNDVLIICGDFGFLWDGSKKEKRILKKLGRKKYYTVFVDGCHENYDLLDQYPEEEWNGGRVRIISGKLMQLIRGSVYEIQGKKIFAFGGGQSDDMDIRRGANTWWKAEIPNAENILNGRKNLEKYNYSFDYIVTHEPPSSIKDFLQVDTEQRSEMGAFFDEIKDKCSFKCWFFGKYHINKTISSQYQALFNNTAVIK